MQILIGIRAEGFPNILGYFTSLRVVADTILIIITGQRCLKFFRNVLWNKHKYFFS